MVERPSRASAQAGRLACALAVVAGLAACGGDAAGDSVELRVGVVAIADVAPLYLGRERGFFEDENLTVEPELAEGGAAITPAVLSGDLQFGFSNTVSLLIAAAQRRPVRIVAQGALAGTDEAKAWADLLVDDDGGIDSGEDLEGGTIAVNTLNNICEVTIKASLEQEGVDVSTLRFTELPIREMNAALQAGRVDGACVVEPFVSQGKAAGSKGIDPFYIRTAPDLTVATYFTSARYAAERPGVVERFVRAMNRSLAYAQSHPAEVRAILPEYMEIPPESTARIQLPTWRADLNRPTIERLAELAQKYGLIEDTPDLDALILAPS
jgi:NitT/TauT family transport system substrate-binding protein